jgi:hypothetical protein
MLGPLPQGHGDFWATVHVRFPEPASVSNDPAGKPLHGYFRYFGVRALPNKVHAVIDRAVDDGTINWGDTKWHAVDPAELKRNVRSRIEPVVAEGIWYKSGRILYSDDEEERRVPDETG